MAWYDKIQVVTLFDDKTATEAVALVHPADVSLASPRDLLVNMIAKAITTGTKIEVNKSARDNTFFAGRVSAFVYASAMTAHVLLGADFEAAKRAIRSHVEEAHISWSEADLRDAGRVGNGADAIATLVLNAQ